MEYRGSCHCGAIGYRYTTALAPERWPIRACQCTFCLAHGGRYTSDPRGTLSFELRQPEHLQRYRFGHRTADFLICRECGVCIGVEMPARFGIINVNTLAPGIELPPPERTTYDGETEDSRLDRRAQRWTPLA